MLPICQIRQATQDPQIVLSLLYPVLAWRVHGARCVLHVEDHDAGARLDWTAMPLHCASHSGRRWGSRERVANVCLT